MQKAIQIYLLLTFHKRNAIIEKVNYKIFIILKIISMQSEAISTILNKKLYFVQ